jgi:hypothetical protein
MMKKNKTQSFPILPYFILLAFSQLLFQSCSDNNDLSGTTSNTENSITGSVTDKNGQFIAGAHISLKPANYLPEPLSYENQRVYESVSDSLGTFSIQLEDSLTYQDWILEIRSKDGDSLTGLLWDTLNFADYEQSLAKQLSENYQINKPVNLHFNMKRYDHTEIYWMGMPGTGEFAPVENEFISLQLPEGTHRLLLYQVENGHTALLDAVQSPNLPAGSVDTIDVDIDLDTLADTTEPEEIQCMESINRFTLSSTSELSDSANLLIIQSDSTLLYLDLCSGSYQQQSFRSDLSGKHLYRFEDSFFYTNQQISEVGIYFPESNNFEAYSMEVDLSPYPLSTHQGQIWYLKNDSLMSFSTPQAISNFNSDTSFTLGFCGGINTLCYAQKIISHPEGLQFQLQGQWYQVYGSSYDAIELPGNPVEYYDVIYSPKRQSYFFLMGGEILEVTAEGEEIYYPAPADAFRFVNY